MPQQEDLLKSQYQAGWKVSLTAAEGGGRDVEGGGVVAQQWGLQSEVQEFEA